jgi:hypothetical protein
VAGDEAKKREKKKKNLDLENGSQATVLLPSHPSPSAVRRAKQQQDHSVNATNVMCRYRFHSLC